jgi:nitrate/TMAO reductase-like tetraheme cytochrome c subunit
MTAGQARRRAMASRIRRLWKTLWGKLVLVACFAAILFAGTFFIAAKATESNRFCGYDCHEMIPYAQTWQASKHAQVDCVKCHIPPGPWNLVKTKFFALRELQVHFLSQVKAPIAVTRKIPNSVCEGCHPASSLSSPVQLATTSFAHTGHTQVPACVDCHSQLVHHPISGTTYVPPQSMTACFACHDGKQQPNTCDYCHKAPHPNRGACQDCHNLESWVPGNFHHPVPLVGPHATTLCESCHTTSTSGSMGPANGCVDCHGDHHNSPKLTLCATCHTTTHFVPSTFVHQQVGPHVPSGDQPLQCTDCHTQTLAVATCSCHGGNPPKGGG